MTRWLVTAVICMGAWNTTFAADEKPPTGRHAPLVRDIGTDRAVAGGAFSQVQAVAGDLLAAGGTVDVFSEIGGDALLAGGTIRVAGPIKQGLYAMGGRLTINAPVQRNVRIAGGTLEIGPNAHVTGNVSAACGELIVLGPIDGYLQAGAGRVLINAPVRGDVELRSGKVELGPNASIGGKLRYTSEAELQQDPAAKVQGGVERIAPVHAGMAAEREHGSGGGGWIWTVGLMVLAAALAAAVPAWYVRVSEVLVKRPWMSLLVGFIAVVCLPTAALVLLITVFGAPLALLLLLGYLGLLLVGYVSTGIALGHWGLARWKPAQLNSRPWQALAAAVCVLLLALAARVPWLGALVVLAVLLVGVGAVLMPLKPGASQA